MITLSKVVLRIRDNVQRIENSDNKYAKETLAVLLLLL